MPKPRASLILTPDHYAAWAALLDSTPDLLDIICQHVAHGGTTRDLCASLGVPVLLAVRWLNSSPASKAAYADACAAQHEAWIGRINDELARLALHDVRELLEEDGSLLPTSEWPDWAAAAVTSVEIKEVRDPVDRSKTYTLTKVKLADKLHALELLGKERGMFRDRLDVNLSVNIADGIKHARARAASRAAATTPLAGQAGGEGISTAHPPPPPSLAQKNLSEPEVVRVSVSETSDERVVDV